MIDLRLIDIIEIIGILFGAAMLFVTVKTYFKNTRIKQAEFRAMIHSNFQRNRLAILQIPMAREALAKIREETEEELIDNTIVSILINDAVMMYDFHKQNVVLKNQWDTDMREWEGLFSRKVIKERWPKIQNRFSKDFRDLIEQEILN